MRVLIICWPAPSHFFPLVPFASALRAAGHQVAMTTPQDTAPTMLGSGIHVIQAGLKSNPQVMSDNQLRRLDVHWAELPAAARWLAVVPPTRVGRGPAPPASLLYAPPAPPTTSCSATTCPGPASGPPPGVQTLH